MKLKLSGQQSNSHQFPKTSYHGRLWRIKALICFCLPKTSCWQRGKMYSRPAKFMSGLEGVQLWAVHYITQYASKICSWPHGPFLNLLGLLMHLEGFQIFLSNGFELAVSQDWMEHEWRWQGLFLQLLISKQLTCGWLVSTIFATIPGRCVVVILLMFCLAFLAKKWTIARMKL